MHAVRHLLARRRVAWLVCAAALLLKLLVPTGYMIANDRGLFDIVACPGVVTGTMAMPGVDGQASTMHGAPSGHARSTDHGKDAVPCAYAGLSAPALGSVHAVLLVAALAAVAATALLALPRPAPRSIPYLRPPLRGPPLALN